LPAWKADPSPRPPIQFHRSQIQRSSPTSPGLALRGARLVEEFEMRVAETAIATLRQHEFLAERSEVVGSAFRDPRRKSACRPALEHDRLAVWRHAVLAHAVGALLRLKCNMNGNRSGCSSPFDRFRRSRRSRGRHYRAWSAELDVLSRPKRHAAVAAVAGADIDFCLSEKFHRV